MGGINRSTPPHVRDGVRVRIDEPGREDETLGVEHLRAIPEALGAVSQGITTVVGGQDGGSDFLLNELFARLEGGIESVWVNGQPVFAGGVATGLKPGRVLHREGKSR